MTQITGRTMYVLGAGASFHTGAPLLRDFLVEARLLRDSRSRVRHESFDRVFKWIDSMRPSSYYVELDLDNLEHVFSLAELRRQLQMDGAETLCADLRHVVMDTLDACQLTVRNREVAPDRRYNQFVTTLCELNEGRLQRIGKQPDSSSRDIVVTLNYDVMLDYAMHMNSLKPNYCLGTGSGSEGFQLLKLHGSTNWARCRSCDGGPQIIIPSPIKPGQRLDPLIQHGSKFPFRMSTDVMDATPCEKCKGVGTLEPIIIPPTWSKTVDGTALSGVWASAVDALRGVFQVVVIGYSMPSTDTFFQYLMAIGLAGNPSLNRIVVVNRDDSDSLKSRYERVFARSLKDRGRLKFELPVRFDSFVGHLMKDYGTNVQ